MPDVTVSIVELEEAVVAALLASRVSEANARSVASALVGAEIDGQAGHGVGRLPSYAAQARVGKIDGRAVPLMRETRPASVMVDAAFGFAYPAIDLAIADLAERAGRCGLAAAGIHRSHHAGAVGRHVETLARRGLVALMFANTPKAMAAQGGRSAVFGTNPIAFACPGAQPCSPIVIDMALSVVARGRILAAAQRGEPIPSDWALDEHGASTTDARAALAGTLRPMGEAKGAALALMVEILAACLTGSNLAADATSFLDAEGGPPGTGQLIIALAPVAFGGSEAMLERIGFLAAAIGCDPPARLPGSGLERRRAEAHAKGATLDAKTYTAIQTIAAGA